MGLVKGIVKGLLWIIGSALIFAIAANAWVVMSTRNQIISQTELDNLRDTALILGTGYNTVQGASNPFFSSRILTGTELYKGNSVQSFILSGSATDYYNEPKAMARGLQSEGVPEDILIYDSLGVRTLSSIVRCKEVYNKDRIIIVTQKFHSYRALFISNYYHIDAVAVPTEEVESNGRFGVLLREFFARPLAVIDLYILDRRP